MTIDSVAPPQGGLWSKRAEDWADVMEGWNGWGIPLYRHVLEQVPVGTNSDVLDVGCGAGRFLRMAADRGARCAALDGTPEFTEITRSRIWEADVRVGDMLALPWADDSFDLVTGFNSFFLADDVVAALREARRVARLGGAVATTAFGRPERCQSTEIFKVIGTLMPEDSQPGPGSSGEDEPIHAEGRLEASAREAGLEPIETGYLTFTEYFPDTATLLRGFTSAPPFVRAIATVGEDNVRKALTEVIASMKAEDGSVSLAEEATYLIASA